jgi:hypothetical protein
VIQDLMWHEETCEKKHDFEALAMQRNAKETQNQDLTAEIAEDRRGSQGIKAR